MRWMDRKLGRHRAADMKLLRIWSMGDDQAFQEMRQLYNDCPREERPECMKEIGRHYRAMVALVNREKYMQGIKN